MNSEERTQVIDSISRAGDAVVLAFGSLCMSLLESGETITAEDAYTFAQGRNLL